MAFTSTILLLATIFGTLYVSGSLDEVDAILKWKANLHSQNTNTLILSSWTNDIHNLNISTEKKCIHVAGMEFHAMNMAA